MSSASDPPVHAHCSGSSVMLLYDLIAFFPSRDPKPRSQSGLNAGVTACHRAAVCWSPGAACPSERQISGSKELREPPAKGRARQEMLTMHLLSEYFRISKRMKYVGQQGYGVRVLLVTLLQPAPGAGGQPGTKGACAKGGSCWKPSGLQRGSALPAGRGSQPHRGVMGMCPGGSLTSPSALWY